MKAIITLISAILTTGISFGQIVITPQAASSATTVVVNNFAMGQGLYSITNVLFRGGPQGLGTFTGTSNLGITDGIILSSGSVVNIAASAGTQNDVDHPVEGDPDLQTLTPNQIRDVAVLEFDFVPVTDTLHFRFVFGSEEYPEYVCSVFNDVLGMFVTGPNPAGGLYNAQNFALIPGTSIPVGINSVNPGIAGANSGGNTCSLPGQSLAYSSLYNANSGTTIIFDGLTTVIEFSVPVVVTANYHLKIGVGDASDGVFDSGLFLQAYSLGNPLPLRLVPTSGFSTSSVDTTFLCTSDTVTLTAPVGVAYSWTGTGDTTQSITTSSAGTYQVIYFNPANGAMALTTTYQVIEDTTCIVSGIDNLDDEQPLLFPNPFYDRLTVELPDGYTSYKLCSINGDVVAEGNKVRVSEITDLGHLPQGVYILSIFSATGSRNYKVVHRYE